MQQAQAQAIVEPQRARTDHARGREDAYQGRKPSFTREQFDAVSGALGQGQGVSSIAVVTGLTRQTIYRIRDNPAEAEAALARWEPTKVGRTA